MTAAGLNNIQILNAGSVQQGLGYAEVYITVTFFLSKPS